MTYFSFLLAFLIPPILVLLGGLVRHRPTRPEDSPWRRAPWIAIGIQILLAVTYTTPWDNYLVATGVWTYSLARVSGIVLGYVPLEEYIFFVLEALLVGTWWLSLRPSGSVSGSFLPASWMRVLASASAGLAWLASTAALWSGWEPGTYLVLITSWALLPIGIQLAFGADLLWHYRRLVAATIPPIGLYLSVADALAIKAGIWAIDSRQTTGLMLCSLPLEEGLFFLVTASMLGMGMTLSLMPESQQRFGSLARRLHLSRLLDRLGLRLPGDGARVPPDSSIDADPSSPP